MIAKDALRAELLAQLTAALDTARTAHAAAVEGATHPEAAAENDKDTRGLEQSYLARGQAQRVAELDAAVAELTAWKLRAFTARDAIALGALVTLRDDDDDTERSYLVAPSGGGSVLASGTIHVITPQSPLARALAGKHTGDDVELALAGKRRTFSVVAIR